MLLTKLKYVVALLVVVVGSDAFATTIMFGSGVNQFTIDFVTIGRPGNVADTTGNPNPAGAVSYAYQMGTYEVSENMINKFNASQALQITINPLGLTKPATAVSWNEAARFVNWLNTSTGGSAAYKFTSIGVNDNIALWTPADTLDYDPTNLFRSKRSNYVLPSSNEWYKAAYYNPTTGLYSDFPSGLNTEPVAVASGTMANTAVYLQGARGPADVNLASGLSPFGVMGLAGNVSELLETEYDLVNNSTSAFRQIRGGGSSTSSSNFFLSSANLVPISPDTSSSTFGFRVVSLSLPTNVVPEPTSIAIWGLIGMIGILIQPRHRH